jgi:hypothetical protein
MIKAIGWTALGVTFVVGGFYYQYKSLDPCEWMTQEMAQYAGMSVNGLGGTAGVVMGKQKCFENWMDLRVKGVENGKAG